MNLIRRSLLVITILIVSNSCFSQEIGEKIESAIENDDTTVLSQLVTDEFLNECYNEYTFLSAAIKHKAMKSIDWFLEKGADVNKACGNSKSPIFLTCKYGNLVMLKKLIAKGADLNVTYPAKGDGWKLIDYAKKYNNKEIVVYLESLKK